MPAPTFTMYAAPGTGWGGPITGMPSGVTYTPNSAGAVTGVQLQDLDQMQALGFLVSNVISSILLTQAKNPLGTVIDGTGGAGLFKIASTVGSVLNVAGEVANNNTKTDVMWFETVLPSSYVAGAAFNVVINAKIVIGAGTAGTKTLTVAGYKVANDGVYGSNIGPAAQNLTNSNADYTFAMTGTGLLPGDRIQIGVTVALQETASSNINAQINSIRIA